MAHKEALRASLESTKAEYRRLGKSGLRISVPILGAMSFGDPAWQSWILDEDKALPLLKAAYDRGLNTWDTADIYSNGHSEEVIAKAIKTYHIPRDKVVLMTKCFAYIGEEHSYQNEPEMRRTKDYVNHGGLSRQAIFHAVQRSLQRLDTTYIDLYQIHRFDPDTPPEETMQALNDLVRSGKVRYIGASSMWTYQFATYQNTAHANGWTKFVSMQNHYNLLYREEEREMIPFCDLTGVGLIPWAPLCRGILARPPSADKTERSSKDKSQTGYSEVDQETVKRVQEIAKKRGWSMSHVSLAWINKRVTSPIIGFSSVQRIDEALEANGKELTDDEEKYLGELYQARSVEGHT